MISIASFFTVSGVVLAIFVYFDTRKHPQAMTIMNIVWPLTMLWASWIGLAAYFSFGRQKDSMQGMDMSSMDMGSMGKKDMGSMDMDSMGMGSMEASGTSNTPSKPATWQGISLSTLHCGAGCALADIIGESLASVFGLALFSGWALDYFLALLIGVYFQYMAIQQMGRMQPVQAIIKAIKVDFFSLSAWQVGMYAYMGMYLVCFTTSTSSRLSFEFWFAMQIAMLVGFALAYPMNKLLIKKGIKHAM